MPILTAMMSSLMMAAAPVATHEAVLDHAGTAYRLSYAPKVTTRVKTVGQSIGTRQSTERCRWAMDVQVERRIAAPGEEKHLVRTLADTHSIEGDTPGNCRQGRRAIATAQQARQDDIRQHLAKVASADRMAAVAEIDAARALALN